MTAILLDIATRLGMEWASFETEEAYRSRLMASAASAWLLSLTESGDWVGVKSLQETVTHKLSLLFESDASATVSRVLKTLMENGFLLRKQEHVAACETLMLQMGEVSMIRGHHLSKTCFFSGACAFEPGRQGEKKTWTSRLDLPDPREDYLSLLFERGIPEKNTVFAMEYLNYDKAGFWMYDVRLPAWSGPFLGVTRDLKGNDLHCVIQNGEIRRIPDLLDTDDLHSYARHQVMRKHAPVIRAEHAKQLVRFSFAMELPRPEMRFLYLVAWPEAGAGEYTFSVHSEVWPIVEKRLKALSFKIDQD